MIPLGPRTMPRPSSGQVLVITALMLPILFGCLALSADLGYLYYRKRRIQTAADAGAIFGAQEIRRGNPAQVTPSALEGTQRNGFTNGAGGTTVSVNHPPSTGTYAGNSRVVEVTVCQNRATFFMPLMDRWSENVCARGVAGFVGNSPNCVYTLNPTAEKTLLVSSTKAVLDADCGLRVNSSNSGGLWVESGACLRAETVSVAGSSYFEDVCQVPALGSDPIDPNPITQTPPEPDPLAYLPTPATGACENGIQVQVSSSTTLDPGDYCKGLKIDNGAQVTLRPGIYRIRGELFEVVGSNTKVTGTDVMIFLTDWPGGGVIGKGMKVGSGGAVNLSAPTSGPYEGIAIYVDRRLPFRTADVSFESGSSATINGAIYAKNQLVRVHSQASSGNTPGRGMAIVSDFLEVTSSDTVLKIRNDFSSFPSGSPIKTVVLVE